MGLEDAMMPKQNLKRRYIKIAFASVVAAGIIVVAFCYFRADKDVRDFMREISRIDDDVRRNGLSGVQQHEKVYEVIRDSLDKIQDPEKLKAVFYACEEPVRKFPFFQLRHPYVYHLAATHVLFRLANLQNDAGAKILVEFLSDENLTWDGESALNILEALIRCGPPCIPYLSNYTGKRADLAQKALTEIQNGGGSTLKN